MRVTSDLWVSALTRRVFAAGGFAAIMHRGASEAGAIFVTVRDRMGGVRLYGPAAQTSYAEDRPAERLFTLIMEGDDEEVAQRIERERRFDPDLWVVDLDTGNEPLTQYLSIVE